MHNISFQVEMFETLLKELYKRLNWLRSNVSVLRYSNMFKPNSSLYADPVEKGEGGGGAEKVLASLQSSLLMCPYFLMSSLNVLFLKEVPKNAHERQQAKSRIS